MSLEEISPRSQTNSPQLGIADSSSTNAVIFSSAATTADNRGTLALKSKALD